LSITTAILPLLVYFACFLSYIKLLASLLSVRLLSPILEIPCFLCYMAQTTHQQLATTISSRIMFSYEVSKLGRTSNSIDVPHMEFPSISSPVEKKAQAFNFFADAIEPQLRLSPYNEVSPFLATSRVSFTPTHYLLLLLLPPLLPVRFRLLFLRQNPYHIFSRFSFATATTTLATGFASACYSCARTPTLSSPETRLLPFPRFLSLFLSPSHYLLSCSNNQDYRLQLLQLPLFSPTAFLLPNPYLRLYHLHYGLFRFHPLFLRMLLEFPYYNFSYQAPTLALLVPIPSSPSFASASTPSLLLAHCCHLQLKLCEL
jgi:hypothetical protein